MRRLSLCLAVAVAALVFVPTALADGPLFVTQGGAGVAGHDGAFHYVTVPNGSGTLLERIDLAHGQVYGWMRLPGSWGTPAVGQAATGQGLSRDGRILVLASTSGPYSPARFLVVDPQKMKVLRTVRLRGSFTFDAISPDGSRLYLIQYVYGASQDLTDYIVRDYDLRTNRLLPGKIADRTEHEQTMTGTALTRTTSADGRWVYTLYLKSSGEPFIHALDTVGAAAKCIDLPGSSTNNDGIYSLGLSLRDGGRTLAVRWRSGRPWLDVSTDNWQISYPRAGFPWAWVGPGIGAGLALVVGGGALLLRRRRREELEQHSGQELGLA